MIQLFIDKSKKLKTTTRLFLLVFFVTGITMVAVPKNAFASTYGEGAYGDCPYETGCSSPTPSPSPSPVADDANPTPSSSTPSTNNSKSTFSIFDPSTETDTPMATDSVPTFTTQYPIFEGHTIPYATVIIEIDGTPVEITADGNGDWQYKVTDPLPFGEHSIKITIKDKDSNETISENSYKINIAEKAETINNDTASPKNHRTLIIIGIIALFLIAIILLFLLIARSRRKKHLNY